MKQRVGDAACPFNALYWDFLIGNETVLGGHPRMAMPYRNLARFSETERAAVTERADALRRAFGALRPTDG